MRNSLLLLGELSDPDIEWFQQTGQRIDLAIGDVLVQEGEPIKALYILLEGTLSVTVKALGQETQRPIARLTAGEVIGEMSFIDYRPPSATVTAETHAVLLAIAQSALAQKAEADIEFGRRFYRGLAYCLSNRLRLMNVSFPQAGIEVNGTLPPDIDNPQILAHLPVAQTRLDTLIALAT